MVGNIGNAVARRAAAFEMEIHYFDPKPHNKPGWTARDSLLLWRKRWISSF
ncbi:NAD(P)-dependent oxidoreductase [Escherichia coli]